MADSNNISYILDHPQDMLVEYVRVWQGRGGSARAADTSDAPALSWWNWPPPQFSMKVGDRIDISGVSLLYSADGRLSIVNNQQVVLYQTDIAPHACDSSCQALFQNDGNFVFSDLKGAYWAAGTWGRGASFITLSSTSPYLEITDTNCNSVWSTANRTNSFTRPSIRSD